MLNALVAITSCIVDGVVRDRGCTGKGYGIVAEIFIIQHDAATAILRVGNNIVDSAIPVATVDGDTIGQIRRLHGIVIEAVAAIAGGRDIITGRPQRQAVITSTTDDGLRHTGIGDIAMEVDAVRERAVDPAAGNRQAAERSIEPHTHLGVFDPEIRNGRVVQRTADAVVL